MSYVKGTLQSDEKIELWVRLHWINYLYAIGILFVSLLLWIYYITPGSYNKSDFFWLVVFSAGWGIYEFLKLWTR